MKSPIFVDFEDYSFLLLKIYKFWGKSIVIDLVRKKQYINFSEETGKVILNVFNDLLMLHCFTFESTSTFLYLVAIEYDIFIFNNHVLSFISLMLKLWDKIVLKKDNCVFVFLFTQRFPTIFHLQKISDNVYILSVCEKVTGLIQKRIIFLKSAELSFWYKIHVYKKLKTFIFVFYLVFLHFLKFYV